MKTNQKSNEEIIEIKKDIDDVTSGKIDVLAEKAKSYSKKLWKKALKKKITYKRTYFLIKLKININPLDFMTTFITFKHGFHWKDGFISYEVKLFSDEKKPKKHLNIIMTGKC